jgi:D-alanyl-D-alanine dipeptidase
MNRQDPAPAGEDFRENAIPASLSSVDTDEYQNVPVDSAADEFKEPLVDLSEFGIATESFFAREDGGNAPLCKPFRHAVKTVYARLGIALKLQQVNRLLSSYGVELLVLDGYRSVPVQKELWSWFVEEAGRMLTNPTADECSRYALRYCSNPARFNPEDSGTWPTHATGGALDVTLCEIESGKPLFMGGIYLDPSEVSSTRYFEQDALVTAKSDQEAQRNRRLLYGAMTSVGFVSYPFEWWHFDFLTQAWVMNQGFPSGVVARYGLANEGKVPAER